MYNKMKPWVITAAACLCLLYWLPSCEAGKRAPAAQPMKSDTGGSSRDTTLYKASIKQPLPLPGPSAQMNDTGGSSRDTISLKAPGSSDKKKSRKSKYSRP